MPIDESSLAVAPTAAVRTTGFRTAFRDVVGAEVGAEAGLALRVLIIVLNGDDIEEVGDTLRFSVVAIDDNDDGDDDDDGDDEDDDNNEHECGNDDGCCGTTKPFI
mmetsp:Transcript_7512/g.11452  ORF Transcript_7512/g.11452 Transcript_7512/m.11452 type:complete len:106 (-) Transcript_7512:504-821(-)